MITPKVPEYSTGHQFSARALSFGEELGEKKAHCAVLAMVFGRGYAFTIGYQGLWRIIGGMFLRST